MMGNLFIGKIWQFLKRVSSSTQSLEGDCIAAIDIIKRGKLKLRIQHELFLLLTQGHTARI